MAEHDLYVGYLGLPARHRRFLRVLVPAVLWLMLLVAALAARSQRSPGDAVWESTPQKLTGTLVAAPYPMLLPEDGTPVLLVEMGKHGAADRLTPFDGHRVTASGWPLHRDGRRILELESADSAIQPDPTRPRPIPAPQPRGRITLRGEIVDSKCYLGAMKPGEGKTHKECATLCIRGGIPPVLVVTGADASREYYLLLNQDGRPLDRDADPFIADPVEVSGEADSLAGLLRLRICAAEIKRI
jgi:hypothetical protein